jgi:chemosensory pili system protein ChpA (sensor histidine kinase/response regulator)
MWRDRSVMVVEDDDAVRAVLAQALGTELGAYTVVAPDGAEALRWIQRLQPTVVVLDLMLPNVDGFEVARRIRNDPATAATRVIAISALTPVEVIRQRAFEAGCDAFVAKPFRIDELLDLVHQHLRESEG